MLHFHFIFINFLECKIIHLLVYSILYILLSETFFITHYIIKVDYIFF